MSRRKIGDEEKKIWQQITQDLKPLKKDTIIPPVKLSHRRIRDVVEGNQESRREWRSLPVSSDSIPKGLVVNKQVKPGKVVVEARLDLHGMTCEQAWLRLQQFIADCQQRQLQWVLVITGKGGPEGLGVIRQSTPQWLNDIPLVGGFSFARPQDGGTGAFYVRIKTRSL